MTESLTNNQLLVTESVVVSPVLLIFFSSLFPKPVFLHFFISVKSDLEKSNKGCMSSESTARRSLQKINTMVVTSGISSCRMGVESSETCDLSNMLKNLDLKDATDVKVSRCLCRVEHLQVKDVR